MTLHANESFISFACSAAINFLAILLHFYAMAALQVNSDGAASDHHHQSVARQACVPFHTSDNTVVAHLVQPFFDGGRDFMRQFEINAVREANMKFFSSSCFPETRNFKKVLDYVEPDMVNVIANSDILFDRSILDAVLQISRNKRKDIMYALTRYEVDGYFSDRADSQDAWVFHGNRIIQQLNADFLIGAPGFDNRIAHEMSNLGYRLYNPSKTVHVWHVHATQERSYTTDNVIPPPYYAVKPVHLTDVVVDQHHSRHHNLRDANQDPMLLDRNMSNFFGGPFEYIWDDAGKFEMHYLL